MIRTTRHGDVIQFEMSSSQTRRMGLKVSAFVVRGVMVDTGFPRIRDEFRQLVDPRHLRGAMVTHFHEDHAGNVQALVERGLPVAMSIATRRLVESPAPIGWYRRLTWGSAGPVEPWATEFVADDLALMPAPGHSPDHHVVWDRREGNLFSGDLFIGVKVRVAHHGEDLRGTIATLRRIIDLGPQRMFDAHRGLVDHPVDLLRAKVGWMEETIGSIEARYRAGDDESTILRKVMGGEELSGYVSFGDYSRRNFVRSVIATVGDVAP